MTTIHSSTATLDIDRIGRMVLMMSSTSPGEVFNAARVVDRVLRRCGRDWHDLVGWLRSGSRELTGTTARGDWLADVRHCWDYRDYLTEREQRFIESMLDWHAMPSTKQLAWINRIKAAVARRRSAW
jgi:hypothetical protein